MAMNIDKMVEGLDSKVFKDMRGKRIFIGDNVAYCPCRVYGGGYKLKIDNVIGFYKDKKVRTNDGVYFPEYLLVVNDLFDKDELNSRKEEFEKKEADKKALKKSKVITKLTIALWKNNKTNEFGITYIPFKTRPGVNMFAQKDIINIFNYWNNKYPDYTFFYFQNDFKFHSIHETNKKNLFIDYIYNVLNYGMIQRIVNFLITKDELLLLKYSTESLNQTQKMKFYNIFRFEEYKNVEKDIPIFVYNCTNLFKDETEFEENKKELFSITYMNGNAVDFDMQQFKATYNYNEIFNGFELTYQLWARFCTFNNIQIEWHDHSTSLKVVKQLIDNTFKNM